MSQQDDGQGRLPGIFFGYLGQAIARCEGRKREGLELCRHALEVDPFQPESHLNHAAVLLSIGLRRQALRALRAGLAIDPEHAASLRLMESVGNRRSLTFSFLKRTHPANVWFGKLSWWLRSRREAERQRRDEEREERELGLL